MPSDPKPTDQSLDEMEKKGRSRNLDPAHLAALEYLDSFQAPAYANYSQSAFNKMRVYGTGPAFIRISPRKILYRRVDIDAWLASRRVAAAA